MLSYPPNLLFGRFGDGSINRIVQHLKSSETIEDLLLGDALRFSGEAKAWSIFDDVPKMRARGGALLWDTDWIAGHIGSNVLCRNSHSVGSRKDPVRRF